MAGNQQVLAGGRAKRAAICTLARFSRRLTFMSDNKEIKLGERERERERGESEDFHWERAGRAPVQTGAQTSICESKAASWELRALEQFLFAFTFASFPQSLAGRKFCFQPGGRKSASRAGQMLALQCWPAAPTGQLAALLSPAYFEQTKEL